MSVDTPQGRSGWPRTSNTFLRVTGGSHTGLVSLGKFVLIPGVWIYTWCGRSDDSSILSLVRLLLCHIQVPCRDPDVFLVVDIEDLYVVAGDVA